MVFQKIKQALKKGTKTVKDKAMDAVMEKQLAHLPPQQRAMMMAAMKDHPDFFEKMAREMKQAESGKDKDGNKVNKTYAALAVAKKYQNEIQQILMKYQ